MKVEGTIECDIRISGGGIPESANIGYWCMNSSSKWALQLVLQKVNIIYFDIFSNRNVLKVNEVQLLVSQSIYRTYNSFSHKIFLDNILVYTNISNLLTPFSAHNLSRNKFHDPPIQPKLLKKF